MAKRPAEDPLEFDRSQIRRSAKKSSNPALTILLMLGGGILLVCLGCGGWLGYGFISGVKQGMEQAEQRQAQQAANGGDLSGESGFKQANGQIAVKSGAPAKGNSDEAIKLAGEFSKNIRALREEFFTKRKKEPLFSLSEGEFLTYCRLDDEGCVFLVHVPDLRKFKKEAKADLAELAWATAQSVVRSNLDSPPPRLGVGTRGIMFYDQAMVGKFLADDEAVGNGIESRETGTGCEKLLFTFFKEVVVPAGTVFEEATDVSEMSEGEDATDESEVAPENENK
jgi:hypothetical protein